MPRIQRIRLIKIAEPYLGEFFAKAKTVSPRLKKDLEEHARKFVSELIDAGLLPPGSYTRSILKRNQATLKENPHLLEGPKRILSSHMASKGGPLSEKAIIENYLRAADVATPEEIRGATMWYPNAKEIIDRFSKKFGIDPIRTAGTISAMSPMADWERNLQLAHIAADAYQRGLMPYAANVGGVSNMQKAYSVLAGAPIEEVFNLMQSPKTGYFIPSMVTGGQPGLLIANPKPVVDRMVLRGATGSHAVEGVNPRQYSTFADTLIQAGEKIRQDPFNWLQPLIWLMNSYGSPLPGLRPGGPINLFLP